MYEELKPYFESLNKSIEKLCDIERQREERHDKFLRDIADISNRMNIEVIGNIHDLEVAE